MGQSINRATLLGHLGADPEVRHFQNGGQVVTFSLATGEAWTDRHTGERRERTEWHRVSVFIDGLAEVASKYLRKGSRVLVTGRLETRRWTDRDGAERYTTEVALRGFGCELVLLGDGGGGGGRRGEAASRREERAGAGEGAVGGGGYEDGGEYPPVATASAAAGEGASPDGRAPDPELGRMVAAMAGGGEAGTASATDAATTPRKGRGGTGRGHKARMAASVQARATGTPTESAPALVAASAARPDGLDDDIPF